MGPLPLPLPLQRRRRCRRCHRCRNICTQRLTHQRPSSARSASAFPTVSVESTGALSARDLVLVALDILREKTVKVTAAFDAALASETHGVMDAASATRATIAAMRTDVDDLSSRF